MTLERNLKKISTIKQNYSKITKLSTSWYTKFSGMNKYEFCIW